MSGEARHFDWEFIHSSILDWIFYNTWHRSQNSFKVEIKKIINKL